jgi:hypothetical protein
MEIVCFEEQSNDFRKIDTSDEIRTMNISVIIWQVIQTELTFQTHQALGLPVDKSADEQGWGPVPS